MLRVNCWFIRTFDDAGKGPSSRQTNKTGGHHTLLFSGQVDEYDDRVLPHTVEDNFPAVR